MPHPPKQITVTDGEPSQAAEQNGRHPPAAAGEPAPLWNDAGHRTLVERAIWLLASLQPAGPFLSLWTMREFRERVYDGLWAADYVAPFNNKITDPVIGIPIYNAWSSHFFDPDAPSDKAHYGHYHPWYFRFVSVREWEANALTQVRTFYDRSSSLHSRWRARGQMEDLREAGYLLGLALHYLTDLTQPMHTGNFTNFFGGVKDSTRPYPPYDYRHKAFEKCADDLLFNLNSRRELLADPGEATMTFGFENIVEHVMATARHSKRVFVEDVQPLLDKMKAEDPPRLAGPVHSHEGLPIIRKTFPAGQIAIARCLQTWARMVLPTQERSDWIAVSEWKEADGTYRPCAFYRKDGDLKVVFQYQENGQWRTETDPEFNDFGGMMVDSSSAFGAAWDPVSQHPAAYFANFRGELFYFQKAGTPRQWKKIRVGPERSADPQGNEFFRVRGALSVCQDRRYGRPTAFYRNSTGRLIQVYWEGDVPKLISQPFDQQPKVGGAISVTWDPQDCGLGERNGEKGHVAVSYIGDGRVHHWHMRQGKWTSLSLPISDAMAHADPLALASLYHAQLGHVVIAWGLVTYEMKPVRDDREYQMLEQQPTKPQFTEVSGTPTTSPLPATQGICGGIGLTSTPSFAVHCKLARGNNGSNPYGQNRLVLKWSSGGWLQQIRRNEQPAGGPIATSNADGRPSYIGYRQIDGACFISAD